VARERRSQAERRQAHPTGAVKPLPEVQVRGQPRAVDGGQARSPPP